MEPIIISAGGTYVAVDGAIYVIDPAVSSNVTFTSPPGQSVEFEVQIAETNGNNFDLNFGSNTNPNVQIENNVDISDVKIDAANAESITLTVGNNVSLEEFDGSDGADTVTIGDNFTTLNNFDTRDGNDTVEIGNNANFNNQDIDLGQGDNSLIAGSNLLAKDIKAEDGNNTISIGDNANIEDIDVKDGDNTITLGNGVTAQNIKTDNGDNTITIGNDLSMNNIDTGDGSDTIVIGDNAVINDLKSDKGDDSITIGDNFVIDKLEAGDGDDFVRLGDGGTINNKLDGGKGSDTLSNGNDYGTNQNFENVVCFAAGTLIATPDGSKAVETFNPGDLVLTIDNGAQQAVRWIGKRFCSANTFEEHPNLRPIRIRSGAMGGGQPTQDLVVSPQHRVLISSRISKRMFGQSEVLVAAKQLVALPGIEIADDISEVTYVHLLCDQHEIIFSNGAPTETLYLGTEATKSFDAEARQEIDLLFPNLDRDFAMKPSRHLIPGRPSRSLAARHLKNGRELLEEFVQTSQL